MAWQTGYTHLARYEQPRRQGPGHGLDDLFLGASQKQQVTGIITNRAFGETLSAGHFLDAAQAFAKLDNGTSTDHGGQNKRAAKP